MKFINKAKSLSLVITTMLFLLNTPEKAIAQYYGGDVTNLNLIKFDGIEGNIDLKGLEDYNQITSWSTGISFDPVQKLHSYQEVYITVPHSKLSTGIFKSIVAGKVIPTVTISVVNLSTDKNSIPKINFKFTMRNVRITSFQMGGSDGSTSMLDQLGLNYESGTYEAEFDNNQKVLPNSTVDFKVKKPVAPGQY